MYSSGVRPGSVEVASSAEAVALEAPGVNPGEGVGGGEWVGGAGVGGTGVGGTGVDGAGVKGGVGP